MQTIKPRLSVLTPIWNANKKLNNYLHYIQLLYNVLNGDIEFVVVIGGTDDTYKKLQEFKVQHPAWNFKLIYEPRKSIGLARNLCLDNATGEFIQFYDHDDSLYINNVVKLLKIAESPEYCDINIFTGFYDNSNKSNLLNEFKKKHPHYSFGKTLNKKIIYDAIHTVGTTRMLFRRNWLLEENIIRFNENVSPGEDFVFIYNIVTTQPKIYIANLLIYTYTVWKNWNQKWKANKYSNALKSLAYMRLQNYIHN